MGVCGCTLMCAYCPAFLIYLWISDIRIANILLHIEDEWALYTRIVCMQVVYATNMPFPLQNHFPFHQMLLSKSSICSNRVFFSRNNSRRSLYLYTQSILWMYLTHSIHNLPTLLFRVHKHLTLLMHEKTSIKRVLNVYLNSAHILWIRHCGILRSLPVIKIVAKQQQNRRRQWVTNKITMTTR